MEEISMINYPLGILTIKSFDKEDCTYTLNTPNVETKRNLQIL